MITTNMIFLLISILLIKFGESKSQTKLMVLLLDGYRWDYFDRPNLNLPGMKMLLEKGTRVKYTTMDFPTLSIPNYYTLMTGLHTENHGMIGNYFYDKQHKKYFLLSNLTTAYESSMWEGAEPLWVTAEKQGRKAYMFNWPGCGMKIHGMKPTHCAQYYYPNDTYPGTKEMSNSVRKGMMTMKDNSADLVGIFVESVDAFGHTHGPTSMELNRELEKIDAVIQELLTNLTAENLADDVAVMLFSDHGMTEITPERSLNLTDYYDINDLQIPLIDAGPISSFWAKDEKIDKVYNDLLHAKSVLGHFEVYKKNQIPERWHYRNNERVAPIIVVADLGWFILHHDYLEFPSNFKGYHGYDPKEKDMRGIFVVTGPGIKKNVKTRPIHAVDIYQLMCNLLNIKPLNNNGTWSHVADFLSDTSSANQLELKRNLIFECVILIIIFNKVITS